MLNCIETDFAGVFDRETLAINSRGFAANRDGIVFMHDFTKVGGQTSKDVVDAEYQSRRQKFDYLAAKTIRLFKGRRRVLYVIVGADVEALERISLALSTKHPRHRFFLLSVVETDCPRGLVFADRIKAVFEVEASINKREKHRWQGNDEAWGNARDPVRIRRHLWGRSRLKKSPRRVRCD